MKVQGFAIAGIILLQACTPTVPASNAGPSFQSATQFEAERARRDAELAASGSTSFEAPTPVQTGTIGSTDLAEAGIGADPVLPVTPSNNVAISDEQDFSAVSSRESIESDAARRAAQAAARQQVAPTALPTRPANTGPNIVAYALNAPNVKGQEWYSRFIFATQSRFQRNCAKYGSPDAAQRDFLARGGPDRDRLGIDPDGDGFACGWDPAPFKLVASN